MTSHWAWWRLKQPAFRLLIRLFIQAQIKETTESRSHWPLREEYVIDQWIPCTKGLWRGKYFHLMTSSSLKYVLRKIIHNWLNAFIITMTSHWAWWRLKQPAFRLLIRLFIQAQIKETTESRSHWPLREEYVIDQWIPCTKGLWRGKYFHLMTSSSLKYVLRKIIHNWFR